MLHRDLAARAFQIQTAVKASMKELICDEQLAGHGHWPVAFLKVGNGVRSLGLAVEEGRYTGDGGSDTIVVVLEKWGRIFW